VSVLAVVGPAVELTGRDRAEVERGGAESSELRPGHGRGRHARDAHDRIGQPVAAGRRDRHAEAAGTTASRRFEGETGALVHDERDSRAVGVDDAERGGEPGDSPRRVRRAVDRVDDGEKWTVGVVQSGLLAQYAETGVEQVLDHGAIGGEIAVVLAGPSARFAPVVEIPEHASDAGRGFVEDGKQVLVGGRRRHGGGHGSAGAVAGWWLSFQEGALAVIDVAGFVADLKDHAVDHGFHVHDERHFVETYSLRQVWEVDLHPEEACGGPLDLHLALEVDPRVLLSFEDLVIDLPEGDDPPDEHRFPLLFTWVLPPLPSGPDLLVLATELAGVGGTDLPLEVSAIDSFPSVTDAPERSLTIVARIEVSLARVLLGQELLCDVLDRCLVVSKYLLQHAPVWLGEE
jgi:hypothetical protein